MPNHLPTSVIRSVEFRAAEGGDGYTLDGYAAVFGQPTRISSPYEGTFNETIAPGAFKKTLNERKPLIQFDHGKDVRTGSVPIAALVRAQEDPQGLHVEARMFKNAVVEPIREAIEGGAINGMSFRFKSTRDSWTDARGANVDPDELETLLFSTRAADSDRLPLNRLVRELQLFEMGPVVNPAYVGTSVGVRSADELTEPDREALMAEYRSTMVPSDGADELKRLREENEQLRSAATERSGPPLDDTDDEGDFDAFDTAIPIRDDGLPDVDDSDYDADVRSAKAKNPRKPYGNVTYADPGYQADKKHRYPLDSAEHVKAAWAYINMPKNANKYSGANLGKVRTAIQAAAPKFGITIGASHPASQSMNSAEPVGAVREDTPTIPATSTTDAAPTGTSETLDDAVRTDTSSHEDDTRKVAHMPKTKEQIVERNEEILELLAAFEADEETRDADLDPEKAKEFDALVAERDANKVALERIQARKDKLRELAGEAANVERDKRTPAFHAKVDYFDVDAIRSQGAGNLERTRQLFVDNAKRAVDDAEFSAAPKNYAGDQSGDVVLQNLVAARAGSKNGDLYLAERILATGSEAYRRAFEKIVMHQQNALFRMTGEEREAVERAMELGVDSQGGYAVPFQLDPTVILTNAGVVNPIREIARQVKITGKVWEGVTSAGTSATRGAEGSTAPDSSFTLAQPTITTNRVQAFVPFTYELDLSWGALSSEITKQLVDAKAREEVSFVTGNGTGTAPQGVLGWTNGGVFGQTASATTVLTATTGVFTTTDIYATDNALDPRFEAGASWLAHKGTYNDIRQVDTAGGSELWARIGEGRPDTLVDYPVYRSSAMTSSHGAASGTNIAILGNFEYFVIADRLGMQVELVPQIFDAANNNRPTGQRGVYAVWMNGSSRLVDDAFRVLQVK
jgi:HK97 family phage major capsid protein/HK97 family phage prohead protease